MRFIYMALKSAEFILSKRNIIDLLILLTMRTSTFNIYKKNLQISSIVLSIKVKYYVQIKRCVVM